MHKSACSSQPNVPAAVSSHVPAAVSQTCLQQSGVLYAQTRLQQSALKKGRGEGKVGAAGGMHKREMTVQPISLQELTPFTSAVRTADLLPCSTEGLETIFCQLDLLCRIDDVCAAGCFLTFDSGVLLHHLARIINISELGRACIFGLLRVREGRGGGIGACRPVWRHS